MVFAVSTPQFLFDCQPMQAWAADPEGWDSAKIRKSKEFVKETVSRDRTHLKTEHMLRQLLGKTDAHAYVSAHQHEATKDDIGILWYPFAETVIDQSSKSVDRKNFQKISDVGDSRIRLLGPKGPVVEEVPSDGDEANSDNEDSNGDDEDGSDDSEQDHNDEEHNKELAALQTSTDKLVPSKSVKDKAVKDMTTFLQESVLKPKLLPKSVRRQLKKLIALLGDASGRQ